MATEAKTTEIEIERITKQLVRNRRKRVVSTDAESISIIERLSSEFRGRDLAVALAAEGFGSLVQVRVPAFRLSQLKS